jgi:hypothetical protein
MNFSRKPFRFVYVNDLDAFIPELWAQESVAILVENMVISNLVHKDFSNEVAKFGDLVHTRKPAEFTALRKTNDDNVTIQDAEATDIQVPLDQHLHTSFMIKDGEESKSFKQLRDEYLQPAVVSIAQALDRILLGESHQFWQNAEGIRGGLTISNVIAQIVETRKRMNINKAYEQGRNMILTPTTEATALQVSTFHEADKVGDEGTAMREASLGRKFQFNMFMCQNAPSTIGVPVNASNPAIDLTAGYAVGSTVIHVDTAGSALKVGHWISVGGVLHHVTALGTLSTEDIDVTISPGLRTAVVDDAEVTIGGECLVNLTAGYAAGYAKGIVVDGITGIIPVGTLCTFATPGSPNVIKGEKYSVLSTTETGTDTTGITLNKPLDVALVNDDEIHLAPPAEHNFAFHRNALALVSRPLAPAPQGLAISAVASANGIGIRVTITYNGEKQGVLVTVDLLCGLEVLDTNLGALLIG